MIEWISQPWPWFVAGPAIAIIMFTLLYLGETFGLSSNFRALCSLAGGGRLTGFFRFDWKSQSWNLLFAAGAITGGIISQTVLASKEPVALAESMQTELKEYGFSVPGEGLVPSAIFSWDALLTFKGLIMLVLGGFLVGFGSRYAGGCTSGHAITGLSNLQLPSLIAVIGFFIGGLIVTHLVLPWLLQL